MATQTEIKVKEVWTFTNIFAFIVTLICLLFLFVAAFFLSKSDVKDNTMLSQITTGVIGLLMLIAAFYFGSSANSRQQQQQIAEMQKTATAVALNANGQVNPAATEMKVDKAVKIAELKAELDKLEPDSEDAKAILLELEQLEKIS